MPQHIELLGSTLADHVHKGPNQAGNKGMLAYNTTLGIPGYTGYIPGSAGLGLPVKGFNHTGRPAASRAVDQLTVKSVDPRKTTTYQDDMHKVEIDTRPIDKTGGGYWIPQRNNTISIQPPFTATTTYRAETLNSDETAAKQLSRTTNLACTLVGYEAARQANDSKSRSISADPRARAEATSRGIGTQTARPGSGGSLLDSHSRFPLTPNSTRMPRPATVPTPHGEQPGYQTTYGIMNDKQARQHTEELLTRTQSTFAPPGDPRFKVLPRVMNPGMSRVASTYTSDHGPEGHDPMTRQAFDKTVMTRTCTTNDLAHGTTRNASHIPRYTGHIPASAYATDEGRAHGEAVETRPDHKALALPLTLDQYPRGRLPGYTGFKPQATSNMSPNHTVRIPSMVTSQGEADIRGITGSITREPHTHHINSREGLMTFFNNSNVGTEFASDNGLFNAQVYFKEVKSQGKLNIRTSQPSKLTPYGAPFRAAASMV